MTATPRDNAIRSISLSLLVIGCILIGLSLVWPSISTGRAQWSDEQAREYQATSAELHSLSHEMAQHSNDADEALERRLRTAQGEFDRLHTQLQAARESPLRLAAFLQILGSLLVIVGAVLYYVQRARA